MTGEAVVFQIGNLNKSMQVPKSQERDFGEDKDPSGLPDSAKPSAEERPAPSAEDPLMEALEYFRQQPVPVKKARGLWPFKKITN
jgi:hypothetical protein